MGKFNNKINFFLIVLFLFHVQLSAQLDTSLHMCLWLRADSGLVLDSGMHIKQWKDLSLNSYLLTQTDSNARPLLDVFSFKKPVVSFDGINDYFDGGNILSLTNNGSTIFLLGKTHTTQGSFLAKSLYGNASKRYAIFVDNNQLNLLYHDESNHLIAFPISNNLFLITVVIDNQNSMIKVYENGLLKGQVEFNGSYDMTSVYNFLVGAYNNSDGNVPPLYYLNGLIGEIVFYQKKLSDAERQNIENYLMDKYAPPIQLPADTVLTSFCPFTIKTDGYFTSYQWSTGSTDDSIIVQQSGKYIVTAIDIFGRESKDSIMVTFPQTQIPDTIIVCYGDSVQVISALGNIVDYQWSNGDTMSYTYVKNEGRYFLTLTDTYGCTRIDSFFVKVDSLNITPLFSLDTLNLCSGNYLTIQNIPYTISNYLWLPTNDTTSSIVVSQSQQFVVEVTNTNGCVRKDSVYVNIIGTSPFVQFTQSHTCFGDSTLLTSTSYPLDNSTITSWQWIINQHDTLYGEQIYFTPQQYGYLPIKLVVQTDVGCSQFTNDSIIVYPLPDADFNVLGFCEQQLTNFLSTTSIAFGQIVEYVWNFGDGTSSIDQHTSHIYAQYGNYQVSFTAISNEGCIRTVSKNIEIKYKPKAGFYHSASCATSMTYFNDTSKTLTYYPILQWKWNFGDGTTSTQQNPVHLYQQVGTYLASLAIKIVNGCTDTIYKSIVVSSTPQASFVHDSACVNQLLHVSDASTIQNGHITRWQWYIGNQYYSNQPDIVIIPQQTGNLYLLLIVESNTHCLDTFVKVINVRPKPVVQFDANPTYGTTPLTVQFDNLSPTGIAHWNFGDGSTSTIFEPQHTYNDTGKYKVILLLTDEYGCYDSSSKIILVVPNIVDLSIENIIFQTQEPYLIVSVNVANTGTLPIENPDLQIGVNGRFLISETLHDTIYSGEQLWYTFTGKINTNWMQPAYVCVQGNINQNLVEVNYQNNLICKALNETTQILNIHPNPVYHYLTLEFQLLESEPLNLSVFNITGKEIFSNTYQGQKNYNRLQLDVSSFQSGLYILKIQSKELVYIYKFLKF